MKAIFGLGLVGLTASPAAAQLTVAPDSGDTGWVLAVAPIALLGIVVGFALRHAGLAQQRAAPNAALSPLAIAAAIPLLWVALGYSLAFGPGSAWIGGVGNLFLGNLADIREGTTISDAAFALLQTVFAIAAPTIIAGALIGRARFGWILGFSLAWSLLVYVPVSRWVGAGWLAGLGTLDFAGGLTLHLSAGVSALTAAWMVGTRPGFRRSIPLPAQSPVLVLAGSAAIWVALLALAGGSALAATDDTARAIVNAHLAAGAGALVWIGTDAILRRKLDAPGFANGALAGLAGAAAVAGYTGPIGAILVGLAASLLGRAIAPLITKLRIDDPAQVAATFGVGGLVGALLLPLAMLPALGAPVFEDAAPFLQQLVAQLVAIVTVLLWSVLGTLITGYMAAMLVPMRDQEDTEPASAEADTQP
ncbi:ammonium transporter [Sphingomonas colocasiae]|uniref:Ammonium transporter n=1 Tax=Sphingomonas colocasiae TaxID=1848973 RepID=A0ABS7PP67_9SPHN|nr:ammonium transporter [Sphingomonas colocasiae]MBY8823115.1 ammonium transporter [Sphingomonas colocasiae]